MNPDLEQPESISEALARVQRRKAGRSSPDRSSRSGPGRPADQSCHCPAERAGLECAFCRDLRLSPENLGLPEMGKVGAIPLDT